jgi:hypothetical protein
MSAREQRRRGRKETLLSAGKKRLGSNIFLCDRNKWLREAQVLRLSTLLVKQQSQELKAVWKGNMLLYLFKDYKKDAPQQKTVLNKCSLFPREEDFFKTKRRTILLQRIFF